MAPGTADPERRLHEAAAHFAAGRFGDAAAAFRDVIRMHPDVPELHLNLGAALRASGDGKGAETSYRRALALAPGNGMAWFNLGNLLADAGRKADAVEALTRAAEFMPVSPEVLNNLGVARYAAGDVAGALKAYRQAIAAAPGFADAHTNLGNALQRLCRMPEAKAALEKALALDPGNATYVLNMAGYLAAGGDSEAALDWAARAADIRPDYLEARLKRASLLIQLGRLEEGFAAYEDRWRNPDWHPLARRLPMPAWKDEPLAGKRLLIWNEQGFGDAILYARYLPLLHRMGAEVIFLGEKPLHRLFKNALGVTCADIGSPPPAADFHASNMSLPHLFKTAMATIPADVPYLAAADGDVAGGRARVEAAAAGRLAVGLAWAGNPGQAHDYSRSIPTELVGPLLGVPGVAVFNLLVGPRGDEIRDPALIDLRAGIGDFADSAALMQALDLVVSVDSAPAHLAGALGRPTLILLAHDPDSRYFLGRDDSPWYPTATLLRQPAPGAWAETISDAVQRLDDFSRKK